MLSIRVATNQTSRDQFQTPAPKGPNPGQPGRDIAAGSFDHELTIHSHVGCVSSCCRRTSRVASEYLEDRKFRP